MTARPSRATIEVSDKKGYTVTTKDEFDRQVRRTALLTLALLATLIFGIIVLVGGGWLPGSIIVGASLIGLAHQVPVISRLCRLTPP